MTAIWNTARHHREFQSQVDDIEKLWLYAQSAVSKNQAFDASLAKAESKHKHGKREAKTGAKKIEPEEKKKRRGQARG